MTRAIVLLHAGGQTAFDAEAVLAYGSLDNIIASDVLGGIPNRETSLGHLWEAANLPAADVDAPQEAETESGAGEEAVDD